MLGKPPSDLLVWLAIHHLGMRTDKLFFGQLRDYLVPRLLTLKELKEILKRGEDSGIVHLRYYIDDDEHKYYIELGSYASIPSQEMDMFGSVILMTLARQEEKNDE